MTRILPLGAVVLAPTLISMVSCAAHLRPTTAPVELPTVASASTGPVSSPTAPTSDGPARWSLFARKALPANASRRLASGALLLLGPGGARWTVSGAKAVSAQTLLPANLVGALESAGGFEMVGAGGDIFVTVDPLGPVLEARPPARPLRSVSVGRASVLGVDQDGHIVRMVEGQPPTSPAFPFATAVADLAMRDDGNGLALGGPRQAALTTDDGATWSPAPSVDAGARRLFLDAKNRLVLEGLTLGYELGSGRWLQLYDFKADPPSVPGSVPSELGGSQAVAEGRAALAGGSGSRSRGPRPASGHSSSRIWGSSPWPGAFRSSTGAPRR